MKTLTAVRDARHGLQPIEDVAQGRAKLERYNLVFLSCAPGKFKALAAADQQAIVANLQTWTQKGGRLFVTDNSYDYVAQAFPAAVTFLNGDATVDAANVGWRQHQRAGTKYTGEVNDAALAALAGGGRRHPRPARNSVMLDGYLNKWSVVAVAADVDERHGRRDQRAGLPAATATTPQPRSGDELSADDPVRHGVAERRCKRAAAPSTPRITRC